MSEETDNKPAAPSTTCHLSIPTQNPTQTPPNPHTGHLLAWTEPTRVTYASGSSAHPPSFTLTGPGAALVRSHSPAAYRRWALPNLPQLQAAVADASALASKAAAAAATASTAAQQQQQQRRRNKQEEGAESGVAPVLRREGLGKRLRRRLWRCVLWGKEGGGGGMFGRIAW